MTALDRGVCPYSVHLRARIAISPAGKRMMITGNIASE
jgi:hypothetical protein